MGKRGTIPLTGTLMVELASAVNGIYKDGDMWFVVAKTGRNYQLLEDPNDPGNAAFYKEEDAHTALDQYHAPRLPDQSLLAVFGPYQSTLSEEGFGLVVTEVAVELDGARLPNRPINKHADMLVWTPAAFNKFVAPYYFARSQGDSDAFKRIQQLRKECFGPTGSGLMIHYWPTRSVGFDDQFDGWGPVTNTSS